MWWLFLRIPPHSHLSVVNYRKEYCSLGQCHGLLELPFIIVSNRSPGTGKTLLARAVAGEAGVPFFFASG